MPIKDYILALILQILARNTYNFCTVIMIIALHNHNVYVINITHLSSKAGDKYILYIYY